MLKHLKPAFFHGQQGAIPVVTKSCIKVCGKLPLAFLLCDLNLASFIDSIKDIARIMY